MPWYVSTSKDSTDTRAGTSADMPIDLRATKEGEDIAVAALRSGAFACSKYAKRPQTSPDMSERATSTKRAKGIDQTDEKLEHSETSDSDPFEMTDEHEDSNTLVNKLRAIMSRQSEEIKEFQAELRTARVKQLEHTELDGADRTIRSLRVRNSNQSDLIRDLQSQLSATKAQYSSDALKLDQANCDLKQSLLEMTQKHDDLQTSVSDLEELNSARREEIESWAREFFTTAQAYEKLKNAMRDEVAAATIPLQALTETQSDQIGQLEKDQQAAEAKFKKLEQSRDKLKDKLESARLSGTKRAVRHRRAYRRLKHDANSVRAELEAVTAERDELSTKLGETEAQLVETTEKLEEHEEDDKPEDCLVVICVDISGNSRWVLDQIKHAYTAIVMFLKTRWGTHARVAVVVHGWYEYEVSDPCEIDESLFYFVERNLKWDPEEQSNSCADDYTFCLSTAHDFLSQEAASKKAVVMIGPGTANTQDEPALDEAIVYLRSNHIPTHSVIIRPHEYSRVALDPSSYPVASLTKLIGGRVEDQETYCAALEDLLG